MPMKKSTRKITDPTLQLQKKMALPVIALLLKTPITANQITIFNFLIFVPVACFLFLKGGFTSNIFGLIAIIIYSFFDLVDGEVARQKNMQSALGQWLDLGLDSILQTLIMFSIAANILLGGSQWRVLAL